MSTAEKVDLVAAVRDEYALAPALAALGLPRSTWYYQRQRVSYAEKYAHLRGPLETIAREHPGYGILRITTELQESYGQAVNHKVVQRLLQLWGLALLRSVRPPRPGHVRRHPTVQCELLPRSSRAGDDCPRRSDWNRSLGGRGRAPR